MPATMLAGRRPSLWPSIRASRSRSLWAGSGSSWEPSAPFSPSAVGAMSVIETRPGIRVESEVRIPSYPAPETTTR
jgi:hypothetical protein